MLLTLCFSVSLVIYLEERDELGDLEAGGGVGGLDDEVNRRAARLVAAGVVDADGRVVRRRPEAPRVQVPENGHEGVAADAAATGNQAGELQARLVAAVVGREVVEEEGASGGEDAAVHADGAVREDDLGVGAVEEGRVEQALEAVAEAAEADGLELGRCGPRRRARGRGRRGGEADGGGLHGRVAADYRLSSGSLMRRGKRKSGLRAAPKMAVPLSPYAEMIEATRYFWARRLKDWRNFLSGRSLEVAKRREAGATRSNSRRTKRTLVTKIELFGRASESSATTVRSPLICKEISRVYFILPPFSPAVVVFPPRRYQRQERARLMSAEG
jgi:hypothetical protein